MKKCLILYCHPNPASFNHAVLEVCESRLKARGFDVRVKDFYAEGYDPVLSPKDLESLHSGKVPEGIRKEQELLSWATHLIFLYPVWWYGAPAMLKGWFDRNFTYGFAFKAESKTAFKGLLKHEAALVIQTAGVADSQYKPFGHDHIIEKWITEGTLRFCGIQNSEIKTYYDIGGIGDDGRKRVLEEVSGLLGSF